MDKNAGSVFEQRNALARLRAHLIPEVRPWPGQRIALLQAYAPFASRLADASGTYMGVSERLRNPNHFCYLPESSSKPHLPRVPLTDNNYPCFPADRPYPISDAIIIRDTFFL
ncbi:hypothetical protein C5L22_19140 [Pantoea ananatis]|nr:hypothetical protein C5L22_19140 [Pantoea ananatis]